MMSARVAGVPIPFSWSTAARSSSSICLPAFSISESRRASVMRGGGLVCSAERLGLRDGDGHAGGLALARRERPQRHLAGVLVGRGREHGAPALLLEEARAGAEALARHSADALHALPDGRTVEGSQEAAHHQVEQALVVAGQDRLGQRAGRNDREVVRDAGVVEDARLVLEPALEQPRRRRWTSPGSPRPPADRRRRRW